MFRKGVFIVLMLAGLLLVVVKMILAADADVVISEVMINAVEEAGGSGEWFEIYNKGAASVDTANWIIEDNNATDTITTTMCPNNSCVVPPGECWLIARSQSQLQSEFDNYTNPLSPTVRTTKTIFIDSPIGGGLKNDQDNLIIKNSDGNAVDCVSWASTAQTVCASLTYVSDGGGVDQTNNGSNGQSITNIQGNWYDHQSNASPYDCINTAEGGDPTAVRLLKIAVTERVSTLLGVGMVLLGLAGLAVTRRH